MGNPVGFCFFLFFPGRKGNGSSFLFRRKEAKENHLRNVYFPLLLTVSPTCSAKRTAHIRAGRFFVSSWMCAKTPSVRNAPLSRFVFCFFSSRKEIVPLLFFLEEKKQKKIICRICFCASLCILRYPVAQNGRLTYEPAVFSLQAGCAGSRLLSENPPQPLRLLFLFSRKEIVPLLFFLEEKKHKKSICGIGFPAAPAAFAGLQHKNGQLACERPFFVPRRMCENVFSTLIILSRYVFCFFSSRKEIVPPSFLFRRKEIVPPSLAHEKAGRSFLSGLLCFAFAYSRMSDTTPDATVRPPSRIAKRNPFSIAIGVISVISMRMLSPGMTISTPSGSLIVPVTSVVRK